MSSCSLCNQVSFESMTAMVCSDHYSEVVKERDEAQSGMKIMERDNQLLLRRNAELRQEIKELRQGNLPLGEA